ncbi:PP2C family protein-serine/threonine phosphatase [Persicobacter psychrovividus]|uniref:PP2C family protein-serine/threonine phosphatase n=1 Tax=Persicobacter psychrovividus TaxID=387638 RepID=UPI0030CA2242
MGKRSANEDYFTEESNDYGRLLVVCDGVGGAERGAEASKYIAEHIATAWRTNNAPWLAEELQHEIQRAELDFRSEFSSSATQQMGTTVVVAQWVQDQVIVAWVGDSPFYHFSENGEQVYRSKDHSMVQNLIDAGVISEKEGKVWPGRNVITRSVSLRGEKTQADVYQAEVQKGDVFFLATDGVLEGVDLRLFRAKIKKGRDMNEIGHWMKSCCEKFSKDNFTFHLVQNSNN